MKIYSALSITTKSVITLTAVSTAYFSTGCREKPPEELPNILWITSEDNSPYFVSCYGNSFATTPNIDELASEGFMYTHAYATHAVSSPTRNSIITGAFANSNGNIPMRSDYSTSEFVHTYPEYLRQAGYYCTNNSKTDYNTRSIDPNAIWDESSNTAHYKNRPEGKPFFAIFNLGSSHESNINRGQTTPVEELRHDPDKVTLPPYHPDTPEIRFDWALYFDANEVMDKEVGELLKELDSLGLAENTIVMYYGDHGGVLPRSKRFLYETGTQVPFVIRIPEKYKYLYPAKEPGDNVDRLISFIDLAPTLCSIAGVTIPDYMQGKAFLGKQKTKDPQYVYMARERMDERYDNVRAVKDQQYRYIRNYMPFRPTMQYLRTLFSLPSTQSWVNEYKSGRTNAIQSMFFHEKLVEELYDSEKDPWNVNNLADDPAYAEVLERMRQAEMDWRREIRDVGLIPEDEYDFYAGEKSMYDYMRSDECPFEELMEAADLATLGGPEEIDTFVEYLKNDHSGIRYWGVTGLLILKDAARPVISALKEAAYDRSGSVATLAAEALYGLGEKEAALQAYINILQDINVYDYSDRNWALNSIDIIHELSPEIASPELINAVKNVVQYRNDNPISGSVAGYEMRTAPYLLQKWGVEMVVSNQRGGFGAERPAGAERPGTNL